MMVIEPDHGIVFDPACGSGGMFVQSSHFIEHEGGDADRIAVLFLAVEDDLLRRSFDPRPCSRAGRGYRGLRKLT